MQLDFGLKDSPIYFYTSTTFMLMRIVFGISIGVTLFGWISFIFGIFVRRLAGLEAMMTVQFCWLTIVWLNCYLPGPFVQTLPLKFTTGYNHPFIPYK